MKNSILYVYLFLTFITNVSNAEIIPLKYQCNITGPIFEGKIDIPLKVSDWMSNDCEADNYGSRGEISTSTPLSIELNGVTYSLNSGNRTVFRPHYSNGTLIPNRNCEFSDWENIDAFSRGRSVYLKVINNQTGIEANLNIDNIEWPKITTGSLSNGIQECSFKVLD